MSIVEVITAPRSPWQNAYVERVIGSYWTNAQCEQSLKIFGRALENARQNVRLLNCGTLWRVAGDKGKL
jgi:hypothetical protein